MVLPSSEGINQWQANIIKAEKYILIEAQHLLF
ncbi:MAG: hypothetical protein CLLPBCKN_005583 [Chroococcidiopsis cubana SAG 39.79]|nr:hypothetical protein [Chroococcidiopsis cubana SAG 39.79]